MPENKLYPKRYGSWAGNEAGNAPDYTRCCKSLWDKYQPGGYQCIRKRGFGPDEAYCKQHDPAAVKARRDVQDAKYYGQLRKRRIEWAGPTFLAVLKQIADGHNDPSALARETIAPFLAKEADQP